MKVFGKEVNMVKVIMTALVIIIILMLSSLIGEMFSSAKAGLGVHQLNGTDADYAVSVFASRIQGISAFVLSLLAILFIWRSEIAALLNIKKKEKDK